MPRKPRRRLRPQRSGEQTPNGAPTAAVPAASVPGQKLRASVFTASLLLLSVYLPLMGMVYSESWYRLNCKWSERCLVLGQLAERGIDNLTNYFLHIEVLHDRWSEKESLHLAEVRGIYDGVRLPCGQPAPRGAH